MTLLVRAPLLWWWKLSKSTRLPQGKQWNVFANHAVIFHYRQVNKWSVGSFELQGSIVDDIILETARTLEQTARQNWIGSNKESCIIYNSWCVNTYVAHVHDCHEFEGQKTLHLCAYYAMPSVGRLMYCLNLSTLCQLAPTWWADAATSIKGKKKGLVWKAFLVTQDITDSSPLAQ